MITNAPDYYRQRRYGRVDGTIVAIEPTRFANDKLNGCITFYAVEDEDGNEVHFLVSSYTYVLDFETLETGQRCSFFYRKDAPMPSIEPPQFKASVVARQMPGREIFVGYFTQSLVNLDQSLQLRIDSSVPMLTTNNQHFLTSPINQNLVVEYDTVTKSKPAQTVPRRIIALCR
jgi:hypothetical protein